MFDTITSGSMFARNQHAAVTKDSDTEILVTYEVTHAVNINQ